MHRPSIRRLAAIGALALFVTAPAAACGSGPVSPLPVETPAPSSVGPTPPGVDPTPTATPGAPASQGQNRPAAPRPAKTRTRPPAAPTPAESACLGAVRYEVDTQAEQIVDSLCIRVGGVLRLKNIGPGEGNVEPESLVTQHYEAGVVDVRFVRPGTVTVTIPRGDGVATITVVAIR